MVYLRFIYETLSDLKRNSWKYKYVSICPCLLQGKDQCKGTKYFSLCPISRLGCKKGKKLDSPIKWNFSFQWLNFGKRLKKVQIWIDDSKYLFLHC